MLGGFRIMTESTKEEGNLSDLLKKDIKKITNPYNLLENCNFLILIKSGECLIEKRSNISSIFNVCDYIKEYRPEQDVFKGKNICIITFIIKVCFSNKKFHMIHKSRKIFTSKKLLWFFKRIKRINRPKCRRIFPYHDILWEYDSIY